MSPHTQKFLLMGKDKHGHAIEKTFLASERVYQDFPACFEFGCNTARDTSD
jgi:hypothetical protein